MMSLVTQNQYGECALDDMEALVDRIEIFARRRGVSLELDRRRLVRQLLQYVSLRQQTMSCVQISNPHFDPSEPEGWTDHDEDIWNDWIQHTCSLENWHTEVLQPVFGSDIRLWEVNCDGWRSELMHFLPWWLQRSTPIVRKFDPFPEEVPSEPDDMQMEIDPYLMEHGSAKQRKQAGR